MEINFLAELLDIGLMIAIVGFIEAIKGRDKKAESRDTLYFIFFIVLCLAVGFFITMKEDAFSVSVVSGIGAALIKFLKYAGLGTALYKWIVKKYFKETKDGGTNE